MKQRRANHVRIIGGAFKGQTLRNAPGGLIRPSSSRLRETIFNLLLHRFFHSLTGLKVLDLFCGTGALGLEALSRGAKAATFVDKLPAALAICRYNVTKLSQGPFARLIRADATTPEVGRAIASAARQSCRESVARDTTFDVCFLDPPYGRDAAPAAISQIQRHKLLSPAGVWVLEAGVSERIQLPESTRVCVERHSGKSVILAGKLRRDAVE